MIYTFWILAIIFGVMGLAFLRKTFIQNCNWFEWFLMIMSIFISAISIGVIAEGSWSNFVGML